MQSQSKTDLIVWALIGLLISTTLYGGIVARLFAVPVTGDSLGEWLAAVMGVICGIIFYAIA